MGDTSYRVLLRLQAILLAAKDDYEGGYLNKIRDLIQAEVFESELEQAQELFRADYLSAAAVIAGVVLAYRSAGIYRSDSLKQGTRPRYTVNGGVVGE